MTSRVLLRKLVVSAVVGGESVPVGDEEVALVLAAVLELDPVGEGAHVVA